MKENVLKSSWSPIVPVRKEIKQENNTEGRILRSDEPYTPRVRLNARTTKAFFCHWCWCDFKSNISFLKHCHCWHWLGSQDKKQPKNDAENKWKK